MGAFSEAPACCREPPQSILLPSTKCHKGLAAASAPRAKAADGLRSAAGLGPPGEHPEPWPGAEGWFQSVTPSGRLSQGREEESS